MFLGTRTCTRFVVTFHHGGGDGEVRIAFQNAERQEVHFNQEQILTPFDVLRRLDATPQAGKKTTEEKTCDDDG